jgi:hypothetical protein
MRQRGRKSSAQLVAIGIDGKPPKLTPPADLKEDERAMFVALIDACDARHFRPSDLPLLTSYIQATLLARGTARDPDKVATWEKAVRVQAALATRLRLSPQSRTDPKTIGRHQQRRQGLLPWEM